MLLSFTMDTLILLLHCWQQKQNKEVVVEEDVAPDVAPANSSDDESIEEESDGIDKNEEYAADADEESKRQQGLEVEARTR